MSKLRASRRAYDLDSSSAMVRTLVALAMLNDGHPEEARAIARTTFLPPIGGIGVYVLGATGDRAGAAAAVRDLEARQGREWSVTTALTYGYLGLGDTARALAAMEAAARAGERPHLPLMDPMFHSLRRSARFAAAVRGFGLDERLLTLSTVRRR